jgi:predicted XRE-type DNA-binding protein
MIEMVFMITPLCYHRMTCNHAMTWPGKHLIKAGLVARFDRIIRQRKLTQAAAAQLMGVDQPKVSAMLVGQFRGYSVERLMRFLVALGHDVGIVVKSKERAAAELRVA